MRIKHKLVAQLKSTPKTLKQPWNVLVVSFLFSPSFISVLFQLFRHDYTSL